MQYTDCLGNFLSGSVALSTARTNVRVLVQDSGGGLAFANYPSTGGIAQGGTSGIGLSANVLVLHLDDDFPGAHDDKFDDSSGHGNNSVGGNGTAEVTSPNSVNAAFGQARTFSGSNHIRIPAAATLDFGGLFTFQAWIRPTAAGAMPILEYNDGAADDGLQLWVGNSTPTATNSLYALFVTTTGIEHHVESPTGVVEQGAAAKWQHVALTYNGSVGSLYHNGVLVASKTIGNVPLKTNRDLYIGRRVSSGKNFTGDMDEIVVTSRSLSGTAIANAYHGGYMDLEAFGQPARRVLLSTGANSNYGSGSPTVTPLTGDIQGRTSITTVTLTGVDLSTGSTNDMTLAFRDISGASSRLQQTSIGVNVNPPSPPQSLVGTPDSTLTDRISWSWAASDRICLRQVNPDLPGLYRIKDAYDHSTLPTGDNLAGPPTPFVESGLNTNTIYGRKAAAFDAYGESDLTPTTSVYTQAAVPNSQTLISVSTGSMIVDWGENGNPLYTRYEVSLWNSDYTIASSTPIYIADNHTDSSATLTGLTATTTQYIRVRAKNGRSTDNLGQSFSGFLSTAIPTLPGKPSGLTATIDSATEITWSWPAQPTARSYRLLRHPDNFVFAHITGLSFQVGGIAVNTEVQAKLQAVNGSGDGLIGDPIEAYTNTWPPTGTAASNVSTGSVTIAWNANNNPSYTVYQVFKATDNGFAGTVESKTATQTTLGFSSLLPGTTYYFRVRSKSSNGTASAYDTTVWAVTDVIEPISQAATPATPYAIAPGAVAVYHFDESTGTIVIDSSSYSNDGVLTCSFVNCSTPTYTAGRNGFGTAVDFSGIQNTYCGVPDAASLNTSGHLSLEAWIKPDTTLQTPGATIVAKGSGSFEAYGLDLQSGKARFFIRDNTPVTPEFHSVSSTQNILAGRWTHLIGVYQEKAAPTLSIYIDGMLSNAAGVTLDGGATARLTNSHPLSIGSRKSGATNYDLAFQGLIDEVHVVTAELTASSAATNYQSGSASTITMPSPNNGVSLIIPPDAFGGDTTISVSSDPIDNPIRADAQHVISSLATPPQNFTLVPGTLIEVVPSQSGVAIPAGTLLASSVTLAIAYPDQDSNALVDGTSPSLPARTLKMYRLHDAVAGRWDLLPSFVDQDNKRVVALTNHFSVFALFGPSGIELDTNSVTIYPIPWKPGSGGRFDNATHHLDLARQGLAFGNLTEEGTIAIFTLSGERVVTLSYSGTDAGTFIWDGTNTAGRKVASGVYFAHIRPLPGAEVLLKFAVER
ncbi:MAG: LamG-like jellyroll fold domain-containing protein [Elusimicrobiota bacterium]